MKMQHYNSRVAWGETIFEISGREDKICGIYIADRGSNPAFTESEMTRRAARQLKEYFRKERRSFDLPLFEEGTEFQQRVWHALRQTPWGSTLTYGELAALIGCPCAARAVGSAAGKNKQLIVTPCHRLISAGGRPGGFSAGLPLKEKLLCLEEIRLP